jgi:hypothetical protein
MRKVTGKTKKIKTSTTASGLPNYKEFLWYKIHEEELLKQYLGRYLVIKDEMIIADYGTKALAWQETIKSHKPGTFIIHHCIPVDVTRLPRLANRQFLTVHG